MTLLQMTAPWLRFGLAPVDPRVTVIQHTHNMGHIATYNDGLGHAQGEYVVLLSADDLLTPGSLARAAAVLYNEPTVGLVYGHPVVFYDTVPPAHARSAGYLVWKGRTGSALNAEGV